ncbi:unnamed protein product, partial [Didymodactylos carnosus]
RGERKQPLKAIHGEMMMSSSTSTQSPSSPSPISISSKHHQPSVVIENRLASCLNNNNNKTASNTPLHHLSHFHHLSNAADLSRRRHSDDVGTFPCRPRRSISTNVNNNHNNNISHRHHYQNHNYSAQEQITTQSVPTDLNYTQEEDDDDEFDETNDELNLAVVVVADDLQSLRAYSEPTGGNMGTSSGGQGEQDSGSLNVAFIDEQDGFGEQMMMKDNQEDKMDEDLLTSEHIQTISVFKDQSDVMDVQMSMSTLTTPPDDETLTKTLCVSTDQHVIEMKRMSDGGNLPDKSIAVEDNDNNNKENKFNDLDEILKRSENRCVRLSDSDDEEHIQLCSIHRKTSTTPASDSKSATPKPPILSSSSYSSLSSTISLVRSATTTTSRKERSSSASLPTDHQQLQHHYLSLRQPLQEHSPYNNNNHSNFLSLPLTTPTITNKLSSLGINGRESLLQLQGELTGRVFRQVLAFEKRTDNEKQQSKLKSFGALSSSSFVHRHPTTAPTVQITPTSSLFNVLSTPPPTTSELLMERALIQQHKNSSSTTIKIKRQTTGETSSTIKRLQSTPLKRWKNLKQLRGAGSHWQTTPKH